MCTISIELLPTLKLSQYLRGRILLQQQRLTLRAKGEVHTTGLETRTLMSFKSSDTTSTFGLRIKSKSCKTQNSKTSLQKLVSRSQSRIQEIIRLEETLKREIEQLMIFSSNRAVHQKKQKRTMKSIFKGESYTLGYRNREPKSQKP